MLLVCILLLPCCVCVSQLTCVYRGDYLETKMISLTRSVKRNLFQRCTYCCCFFSLLHVVWLSVCWVFTCVCMGVCVCVYLSLFSALSLSLSLSLSSLSCSL
jgi:hypothetical protein